MDSLIDGSTTQTLMRLNTGNKFQDINDNVLFGQASAATDPIALNTIGNYSVNVFYHVDVVFNRTALPLNYDGGTLAANSIAIFVDNSKVVDNSPMQGDQAGWDANTISFVAFGNVATDATFDNFELNTDAIPEPSSALLLGGISLLLMRRRRN
jgi:hypothetical protein